MVDCTQEGSLCEGIQQYPSIKMFRYGRKSNRDVGTVMDTGRFDRDMAVSAAMYLTTQILEQVLDPLPDTAGGGDGSESDEGRRPSSEEPMVFIDPEVEDNPEL